MRRTYRSDLNQSELVSFARTLGMQVELIGRPTDAMVNISGKWFPVELKAKKGKYTPAQLDFIDRCAVHGSPMLTWRSIEDVQACYEGLHSLRYTEKEQ